MARKSKAKSQQRSSKAKMPRPEKLLLQTDEQENEQIECQTGDLANKKAEVVKEDFASEAQTSPCELAECSINSMSDPYDKDGVSQTETVSDQAGDKDEDHLGNSIYQKKNIGSGKKNENGQNEKHTVSKESGKQGHAIPCNKSTGQGKNTSKVGIGAVSKTVCAFFTIFGFILGIFIGTLIPQDQMSKAGNGENSFANADSAGQSVPPSTESAEKSVQAKGKTEIAPPMPRELAQKMTELEKAVVANPSDASLWTSLGNLYFDSGQPKKAIEAYEKSLILAPGNPDIMTDLGIMYREAGDFEQAVAQFRAASAIATSHQNALFNEGVVLYYDMGQKDAAIVAWHKLLKVNPQAKGPDGQSVSEMIKHLH